MSLLDDRLRPLEELQEEENLTNERLAEETRKLNSESDKVEKKPKKKKTK